MSESIFPATKIILGPQGLKIGSVDANPASVAQEGNPGDVLFSSTTKKLYVKQDSGTTTSWNSTDLASLSGDVTSTAAGVVTIEDAAIDEDKLADDAVTEDKIADNSVTEDKIAAESVTEPKLETQGLFGNYVKRIAAATYDFAVDGGAVGDISLDVVIPSGAIIQRTFLDVITAPTSADLATIAVKAQGAGDIKAATAIADLTPGLHEGLQAGATANMIKCTAARTLTISVADFDLTAGKFYLFVEYIQSSAT